MNKIVHFIYSRKVILLYILLIGAYNVLICSQLDQIVKDYKQVTFINMKEFSHSFISYVKYKGKIYLVKQKKCGVNCTAHPERVGARIARDTLAAHVALTVQINSHDVAVIPADIPFPGKMYPQLGATLHSLVPGKMLFEEADYKFIQIKQCKNISCGIQGLTRGVIKSMAFHPDLARIVALDTFIANGGRHRKNVFFDKVKNKFFAIDMDGAFKVDLAQKAIVHLKRILSVPTGRLTVAELRGLKIYNEVLKRLYKHFSVAKLTELYRTYLVEAGAAVAPEKLMKKFEVYSKKNHESVAQVIYLVDSILTRYNI